jgi:hypothetical protein
LQNPTSDGEKAGNKARLFFIVLPDRPNLLAQPVIATGELLDQRVPAGEFARLATDHLSIPIKNVAGDAK